MATSPSNASNVVLINPSPTADARGINETSVWPPVGLGIMAAVLEGKGYQPTLIDANVERLMVVEVLARIPQGVVLVGISLNSFTYNFVQQLCAGLRELHPAVAIVLGGPLPSADPELVLRNFPCTMVVRGEGEFAIVKILQNVLAGARASDGVPGGAWLDLDTGELRMAPVERIQDLDSLPFPAYHLLPPLSRYKSRSRKRPIAPMITSRGCAYGCSFCSKDIFQRKVTFRSAENVLEEIDLLVKRYGVRQLDILDDNFAMNKDRMAAILDGLIARNYGLAINLNVGIRSEGLTREVFQKMKQAGVFKVAFGIESADPRVLELCQKKLRLDVLERAIALAKEMGMVVYGFFIIGLPGEDEEAFHRTLSFAKRVRLDIANFCIAVPFVGTELYRQVEAKGRFLLDTTRDLNVGFYSGQVFFEYPGMTKEDVLRRYKIAYRTFYTPWQQIRQVLGMRSFAEFSWFVQTAWVVLKNILATSFAKPQPRN